MKAPPGSGGRWFSKPALLLLASIALFVVLAAGIAGRQRIAGYWARLLGTEVMVVDLSYDPEKGTVTRVGNVRIENDNEMLLGLKSRRVVIAAKPEVPWQDVVHVLDLCKQTGSVEVEFQVPEQVEH